MIKSERAQTTILPLKQRGAITVWLKWASLMLGLTFSSIFVFCYKEKERKEEKRAKWAEQKGFNFISKIVQFDSVEC